MNNTLKKYKGVYNEVIDYSKNFKIGHADHSLLQPGKFKGEICQIISQDVIVCTIQSNLRMIEIGHTLDGFTVFLLPGNMEQNFSWRKHRLTGLRIGLLKTNMKHIAVIPPNFFGTPIGIRNEFLIKLIVESNIDEILYQYIQRTEIIELDFNVALSLQNMIKELCASDYPDEKKLTEELPMLLLETLAEQSGQLIVKQRRSREMIFGETIQYIIENLKNNITKKNLCDNMKISERNLRYLFHDLVGLSPIKCIKYLRLNEARKEIKNSGKGINISSIASMYGFNHSGSFAAYYNKLFGEYPFDTARQKPKSK